MGFLDLFRPKWKHSDPSVRLEAVKGFTTDDAAELAQVVRQDRDPRVRRVALKKIDGKEVWRIAIPKRSWSTPALVKTAEERQELVVNCEGKISGIDPASGKRAAANAPALDEVFLTGTEPQEQALAPGERDPNTFNMDSE